MANAQEVIATDSVEDTTNSPIRGYFAHPADGDWHTVNIGTEFVEIQRLSLRRGKYIVNATAQLAANVIPPVGVDCRLLVKGVADSGISSGVIGGTGSPTHKVMLALTFGFFIPEHRDLSLECRAEFGSMGIVSQPSNITAIRVHALIVRKGIGFER
jgi:hypothetical protein